MSRKKSSGKGKNKRKIKKHKQDKSCAIGPLDAQTRRQKAYQFRIKAANIQRQQSLPKQVCNQDEVLFTNKAGSYTKALPHNELGEVQPEAYEAYLQALKSGKPADFESIPLGGQVKLSNPQAAYVYDLIGPDCHQLTLAIPPAFSSAWEASELAEVYWQALTRDVPFEEYGRNLLTIAASADLSRFSDFRGPKINHAVTPSTLFRGETAGDLIGPYLSQFLWMDIPFGATKIPQKYRTTNAGTDFMTTYEEWLNIQNGQQTNSPDYDPIPRYIRNGRDLAEYVHWDFPFQAILSACLILQSFGPQALDPANPYTRSKTQGGFITFGAAHIQDLVARSARAALEAAWFQKFLVHRRIRPEEFGGRVHNHLTGAASYPIHLDLINSTVLDQVFKRFGTYLLPMSYPEGCPTHPAYPSGHAGIVGAGVTILKAYFNESFVIPQPVTASSDGLSLIPWSGESLTVGGELNKLAANISLGRDTAGVHWRSDGIEGLKLGEEVAIGMLRDYKGAFNEKFSGFILTKFDGTTITIK